jgi:5-methylcytosine-specific restriction endonuclease McrA
MARPAPRLGSIKPKLKAAEFRTVIPRAKQVDSELRTSAHERWRKLVLDRAGWRCQAPGCGRQGGRGGVRLFADHIVERKDGGAPLDPENGMALCASCHGFKTARERAKRHGLAE